MLMKPMKTICIHFRLYPIEFKVLTFKQKLQECVSPFFQINKLIQKIFVLIKTHNFIGGFRKLYLK